MRDYSKISPKFWTGKTGRNIKKHGLETQLLALYLLTCPHAHMIGVYYLPISYIAHDTGRSPSTIRKALKNLIQVQFCMFDENLDYVWVVEMARHQIAEQLDRKDKRVKSIHTTLESFPQLSFLNEFYKKYKNKFHLQSPLCKKINQVEDDDQEKNASILPNIKMTSGININERNESPFEAPSESLRSQEQEQDQEQKQEQEEEQKQKERHRKILSHRHDDLPEKIEVPALQTVSALISVISVPLRDGSEFIITETMIEEWQQLYPSADILQALKNIRGWNLANPTKRKTRKGVLQHINQWLAKENSKQMRSSVFEKPGGFNLFEHNLQVATAWANQDQSFFETERTNERD